MKKTFFIGCYVSEELASQLQDYTKKEEVPISLVIRKAVKNFLTSNVTKCRTGK